MSKVSPDDEMLILMLPIRLFGCTLGSQLTLKAAG